MRHHSLGRSASHAFAAVVAFGTVFLAGCADHSHCIVDADRFGALMRQGASTVSDVEFLGVSGDRVYLTYWQLGVIGGDTHDVYSTPLDALPAAERAALRNGRNPWRQWARTNDPGLRPAEHQAMAEAVRLPAHRPIVVVLRCATGKPVEVARDHFDNTFTTDDVVPVPVPADIALVATTDETATLRATGWEQPLPLQPTETRASWHHVAEPGLVDVTVGGAATTWRLQLRCVPAAEFYDPTFDQRRAKRTTAPR
jgi:hypothetical protein